MDRIYKGIQALKRGNDIEPYAEYVFQSRDALNQAVRPEAIEIPETIIELEPDSIDDVVDAVGADAGDVRQLILELAGNRILEIDDVDSTYRPRVQHGEFVVHYLLDRE